MSDAPHCPRHKSRKMRPSQFGGWFCSAKIGKSDRRCTETAPASAEQTVAERIEKYAVAPPPAERGLFD